MTSRDFCYWLQGFFEINGIQYNVSQNLTAEQITCIRNHLNMVFRHEIDPSFGNKQHVEELTKIHQGSLLTDPKLVDAITKVHINC